MRLDKTQEVVIDLRDLFFDVLYHWRSIAAVVLIAAFLLGGYAYLGNRKESSQKTDTVTEEQEENPEQRNYEASNRIYEQLLEASNDYNENAVAMKTDPYHGWAGHVIYAVVLEGSEQEQIDNSGNASFLLPRTYSWLVSDLGNEDELKDIFGTTESEYIDEMISAYDGMTGTGNGMFRVTVHGPDKETVEKTLAFLDGALQEESKGDIQQLGRHEIIQVNTFVGQTIWDDLLTKKESTAKKIAAWQKAISDNDNAMNKIPMSSETGGNKRSILKFLLLGALFGLIVACGGWMVVYVLARRLRNGELLKDRFGIPVLGELRHSKARCPGRGIDRLIEKWDYRKDDADNETILDSICALIRERKEKGQILLTGTIPDVKLRELQDSLAKRLGDKAELLREGGFLTNSRAITVAAGAAAVILAEEKDVSRIGQIDSMAEKLIISGADVIGAIVL